MAAEYKIIEIKEGIRPSDIRGVEKYYRVTIKTQGGVTDHIDVNEEDFTDKKVAALALARATKLDTILKL